MGGNTKAGAMQRWTRIGRVPAAMVLLLTALTPVWASSGSPGGSSAPPPGALGVARMAAKGELDSDGNLQVRIWNTLQNVGGRQLSNVRLVDDLARQVAPARLISITDLEMTAGRALVNARFDGSTDSNLLAKNSRLATGETLTVAYTATIAPAGQAQVFATTATAFARTPGVAGELSDCSADGMDPDPTTPELEPAYNWQADAACSSTPIHVPAEKGQPVRIGLAVNASPAIQISPGVFELNLAYILEGFGDAPQPGAQIVADLHKSFPEPASFAITGVSSERLTLNPGFDGSNDTDLLSGADVIAPWDRHIVSVDLRIYSTEHSDGFVHSAVAVTDTAPPDDSVPGHDPDPDGNDDPQESHPTPIKLDAAALTPVLGVAKHATPARIVAPGRYRTTITLTVENLGETVLEEIYVFDPLVAVFTEPGGFEVDPASFNASGLTPDPAYRGLSTERSVGSASSLQPGITAWLSYAVEFSAPPGALFFNQALATAKDCVFDHSTDGFDPDPNGDNFPEEKEPTPIPTPELGGVRGFVYEDNDHDRTPGLAEDEPRLVGWQVDVLDLQGRGVAARTTTVDGYAIADLLPGSYVARFRQPNARFVWDERSFEVQAGSIAEVILPFDPQGIVYDSVTRQPVAGARLILADVRGDPLPEQCLLEGQQRQQTTADGAYRFAVQFGADPGCPDTATTYTLSVVEVPNGYESGLSKLLPPSAEPLPIDCSIDSQARPPCLIQQQNSPPLPGQSAQYFASFRSALRSQQLVNNHLPIDPIGSVSTRLSLTKQAARQSLRAGEAVGFTLRLGNPSAIALPEVDLIDNPPAGFGVLGQTAVIQRAGPDGKIATADDDHQQLAASGSDPVVFEPIDLAAGEEVLIRYASRASLATRPGIFTNTATATANGVSVSAAADVEVIADQTFDLTTLIGKVFSDRNSNLRQDPGEPGIPGVRLFTVEGNVITTDSEGRYHLAGIEVHPRRGSNVVIKLDANSLPTNSAVLTDVRRVVRLTPGLLGEANFPVQTDCCTKFVTDPYRTDKKLDIKLHSLQPGRRVTAVFDVRSNYAQFARYFEIALHTRRDTQFRRPLTSYCFELQPEEYGQSRVTVPAFRAGFRRQLIYVLHAYTEPRCIGRGTPPADVLRDTTTPQMLNVRRKFQAGADRVTAMRDILGVDRIPVRGLRQLWSSQKNGDKRVLDYLDTTVRPDVVDPVKARAHRPEPNSVAVAPGASSELKYRQGGQAAATLEVQLKNPLDLTATVRRGADGVLNTIAEESLDSLALSADGLSTSMGCCGIDTTLTSVVDERGDLLAVQFVNKTDQALTTDWELTFLPSRESSQSDVDCPLPGTLADRRLQVRTLRARIPVGAAHEVFVGSFKDQTPFSQSDFCGVKVWTGQSEFTLKRNARVVNGHRLPPLTTVRCGEIEATPNVTADGAVSAIRVANNNHRPPADEDQPSDNANGAFSAGVGQVELSIGGYSNSGKLADAVEDFDPSSFVDGRIAAYWRGAFRTQGQWVVHLDSTYDRLSRIDNNLGRRDPTRLFRQLDPDHHYPTYGDDSTTVADVDTQGAFYGRINWHRSQALWGNFNVGLTDTEFAQYNRTLYGALFDYKSSALMHDESRTKLKAFVSSAETNSAQSRFRATGGSLYFLRHTDVVEGSEKLWVEVRRRDSERLLDRQILRYGLDYEFDPVQGRVLLSRPLLAIAGERNGGIVRTRILDGDDVFLVADYETYSNSLTRDALTYGLRGRHWFTRNLAVGGSYIVDERDGQDYSLKGLDATWRHSAGTYLALEYGRTRAMQRTSSVISNDGGLTFGPLRGRIAEVSQPTAVALSVRARLDLDDLRGAKPRDPSDRLGDIQRYIDLWWTDQERGFSAGQLGDGQASEDTGFEFSTTLKEWIVRGGASELFRPGLDRTRAAHLMVSRENCEWLGNATCGRFDLEGRYEDNDRTATDILSRPFANTGSALILGSRFQLHLGERSSVYAQGQVATSKQNEYRGNDRIAVGGRREFTPGRAASLELSHGDRGDAIVGGLDITKADGTGFNLAGGFGKGAISEFSTRYALSEGKELYGSYSINPDRTDGARNLLTLGQRRQFGNHLRLFSESQFGKDDRAASTAHTFGVELDRLEHWTIATSVQAGNVQSGAQTFKRLAASAGASFSSENTRFSTRFEYRDDSGAGVDTQQYLTSNAYMRRFGRHSRIVGKLNLSIADRQDDPLDSGRFVELDLAYAYRPAAHDTLNLLTKYSFLYDVATEGQSESLGDERAHLVSLEGLYSPLLSSLNRFMIGAKLAYKKGESRLTKGTGNWLDMDLRMAVARVGYEIPWNRSRLEEKPWWRDLEFVAEHRWLRDRRNKESRSGALVGVYKQFVANHKRFDSAYRIGLGYNFSGFDDDLRDVGYRSHGWFLDMTTTF